MVEEFLRNIVVVKVAYLGCVLSLEVNTELTGYMFVSHFQNAGYISAFKTVCINVAVFTELFRLLTIDNFVRVSL
jgi:hypothetical protein